VTYVDTTVTALGVTRRAVLTHSKTLHAKQSRGFDQTLAKARRRLTELQTRLARGKTRRDRDAVQAEIAAICRPRWVSEVITTTFTGKDLAELRLTWRTDTRARQRLKNRIFGKRILFTNRDEWPVTDVITGYRSQSEVESAIRQMKDPHVVSFSPMHHWTDSKSASTSSTASSPLAIAHLMRREAHQAGLHMSARELLNTLAGIQETVLLYHDGAKGRPPSPTHDHRHESNRTTPRGPVQHQPIRAHPLTHQPQRPCWVIHPTRQTSHLASSRGELHPRPSQNCA
jgi:transposase